MTTTTISSAVSGIILSGSYDELIVVNGGAATGTVGTGFGASIAVSSGGSVVSSVLSGTAESFSVFSNGLATSTALAGSGETGTIFAGGTAIATTIKDSDQIVVFGQTTGATLNNATEYVSSGGSTTGTTILAGTAYTLAGSEFVDAGGLANGTMLLGGSQYVLQGGVASAGTLTGSAREYVFSGGLSEAATLMSGAQITVSSAGQTSGTVLLGSGLEVLLSGATATATTVGSSSVETVSSGATASGTILSADGYAVVSAGGVVDGTTVGSGGLEVVSSGATVTDAQIASGGAIIVLPGADVTYSSIAPGAEVISTGVADVVSGVLAADGASVSGFYALADAAEYVLSGGTSVSAAFGIPNRMPGPGHSTIPVTLQTIYSGGVASNTRLDGYAQQVVDAGGVTVSTFAAGVLAGITVSSGGTVSAATLRDESGLLLSSGATATGTVASGGGTLFVLSGASAADTAITLGGTVQVDAGGRALNTDVIGSESVFYVAGEADGGIIAGGFSNLTGRGVLSGFTVSAGGVAEVRGGTTIGTVLDSASEALEAGDDGVAEATIVNSGGLLTISDTGSASGTTVNSGGYEFVDSGGSAAGTIVLSGGTIIEGAGANVTGSIVELGGAVITAGVYELNSASLIIYAASGTTSGLTVGPSDSAVVLAGGVADATVTEGGALIVSSGGQASSTTLDSGGETVSAGGITIDTTVNSGAELEDAGTAYDTTVNAAVFTTFGTASNTTATSGAIVTVYGSTTNTTVSSGGSLTLVAIDEAPGHGQATTLLSGGREVVQGGLETSTVLSAGAALTLIDGGIAVAADIEPGANPSAASAPIVAAAVLTVSSSATTSGTLVGSGGEEQVLSGGTASGDVVSSGGFEIVESGGNAVGTDVQSGGTLVAFPGAVIDNPTIEPGGAVVSTGVVLFADGGVSITTGSGDVLGAGSVEDVLPGGVASGTIVSSGGMLSLFDGSATATTLLPGGSIDLPTISSYGQLSATFDSGTDLLTLSDGIETVYQQTLAGTDGSETFYVGIDASGGALVGVYTPTVTPPPTPRPLTTLAAFDGSDGIDPTGGVIADASGDLFGAAEQGGANADGTLFEIGETASGYATTPTVLASFDGADGAYPVGSLIADANGDLFGTTVEGGTNNDGTVFELAKTVSGYAATPTVLASFNGADGAFPAASLIVDANGDLLGTTAEGGPSNDGRIFEIVKTADGYASRPTVMAASNGVIGSSSGLVADARGDLFGSTSGDGGYTSYGTVFEIAKTAEGYASTPTVLVNFNVADGAGPEGDLIVDAAGDLFGSTPVGGTGDDGTVFEIANTGDGYATTPSVLASFSGADGNPTGGLIIDAAGDLFGTAEGVDNQIPVADAFEIAKTASGYASVPTVLVGFNYENGLMPSGSLIATSDGNLIGSTVGDLGDDAGSVYDSGSIYELADSGYQIACYCPGTLIVTNRGEVPVEALAIGDTTTTASGQHRPIKWLGRRSYAGRFLAANPNVQPIRFRVGSLGGGLPRRDLLVSPEHAMFLDGLLIPARCLVNGSTITQERGLERVDYYHVELDSHDVLLAEGAPSESYLDDDSRGVFHNAHEFAVLYPNAPTQGQFYAPRMTDGYQLEAIRRWLAVVAWEIAAAA